MRGLVIPAGLLAPAPLGMTVHAQGVQASPTDGQLIAVSGVVLERMAVFVPWCWGNNGAHGGVVVSLESGGVRVNSLPGASMPGNLPWIVARVHGLRGPIQRGISTESWIAGAIALNKTVAVPDYTRAVPMLLNFGSYPFGVDTGPNAYLGGDTYLSLTNNSNLRLNSYCYNAGYSSKFSFQILTY